MNGWIERTVLVIPVALAALSGACAEAQPARQPLAHTATSIRPADVTARDFYTWYVGQMAKDKEPNDDPADYARYVSKPLRASIARRMASPDGMDVDYFIKTQDYLDEWIGHVAASPATIQGSTANTTVTLGLGRKAWKLAVALMREDGAWKVVRVTHV